MATARRPAYCHRAQWGGTPCPECSAQTRLGLKLWEGMGGGLGLCGLGSNPVHTARWRAPGQAGRCSPCSRMLSAPNDDDTRLHQQAGKPASVPVFSHVTP